MSHRYVRIFPHPIKETDLTNNYTLNVIIIWLVHPSYRFTGGSGLGHRGDGAWSALPMGLRHLRLLRQPHDPVRLAVHLRGVPADRRQVLQDRRGGEPDVRPSFVLNMSRNRKFSFLLYLTSPYITDKFWMHWPEALIKNTSHWWNVVMKCDQIGLFWLLLLWQISSQKKPKIWQSLGLS